jgi:ketosteroid isomerase-like protein
MLGRSLMKLGKAALLAMIVLGAALYGSAQNHKAAEAIKTADQQWLAVFAAKDLDKSVAFCAEDGAVLAPNSPIAQGHEAIRSSFAGFFKLPGLKISWVTDKVEASKSGDLGYSSGTYEMSFKDPSGKTVSDHGKYVTVWKKQSDGSWKVVRDIFNSDLPSSATQ